MEQQKIFRQIFLDTLRSNIKEGSAIDLFRNSEFLFDQKYTLILPHIERPKGLIEKMNPENDLESALALYEAYKNLSPLEASDPRFWNYLSFAELYPFIIKRWGAIYNRVPMKDEKTYVFDHFFLRNSSELMRCFLPSLWWSVYLSIDELLNNDVYRFTKVLFWNQTLRTRTMGGYLLARKKEIALGFLEYCYERGKENFGNFEDEHQIITEYLNKLGGTTPLVTYNRNEIKDIIKEVFPFENPIIQKSA